MELRPLVVEILLAVNEMLLLVEFVWADEPLSESRLLKLLDDLGYDVVPSRTVPWQQVAFVPLKDISSTSTKVNQDLELPAQSSQVKRTPLFRASLGVQVERLLVKEGVLVVLKNGLDSIKLPVPNSNVNRIPLVVVLNVHLNCPVHQELENGLAFGGALVEDVHQQMHWRVSKLVSGV